MPILVLGSAGQRFQEPIVYHKNHLLCFLWTCVPCFSKHNNRGALVWLAQERVVLFNVVWVLCLYFQVWAFLPFFSVRTFEEWNLPTRENCSDALRRMWITFWKRCWKFCREIAGGKDKLQNSGDKKHSSWGRNFYLYNLERDKNPWNVPRDHRHISDCSSIKLWFSPRSRRYFSMFLMHLRCEKGKQSVVTQCSDENIDMKNEDLFYPQCSVYQQPFISSPMECGGDNSQLCVTCGLCTTCSELQVGIMALCACQKGKQDFPNAYQWAAISSLPNGHVLPGAIFLLFQTLRHYFILWNSISCKVVFLCSAFFLTASIHTLKLSH